MSYPPQGSGPVISVPPTLTGETIDAGQNTLRQVVQSPILARTGAYSFAGDTTTLLTGILNKHTETAAGSKTVAWDANEGQTIALASNAGANVNAGLVSPTTGVGVARMAWATKVRTRTKCVDLTTNSRFYFGFTSATALPLSDTPLANGDSGIIIGWRSSDGNFTIINNDGSGAAVAVAVAGPIPIDNAFRTFEINWATGGGSANVIIDNVSTPISSRLPAVTTNLFFNQVAQTTAGAVAKTQTIHGTFIESVK